MQTPRGILEAPWVLDTSSLDFIIFYIFIRNTHLLDINSEWVFQGQMFPISMILIYFSTGLQPNQKSQKENLLVK